VERDQFYIISLPERAGRASAVLLGGSVYEITEALLPGWVRETRLYQAVIAGLLRITIELVGGAKGILPRHEIEVQEFSMRKAAGTGIEMAGLLTVGWSPLWLFAVAADLTGGVRTYLDTLEEQLKNDGLIVQDAKINSTRELLTAFEGTSDLLAENIDIPPLTIRDLKVSWMKLKANAKDLPDQDRLNRIFSELNAAALSGDSTLGDLSKLLAASAVQAGIKIGNVHIFDFYKTALKEIESEGLQDYAHRLSRPYLAAARNHFDPETITNTQRLLQRGINRNEIG
jgi:hypothetical protein